MPTKPDVAILVFARAPQPGRVKTRLAARIGEWRAATLHARLTVRALRTALAAGCGSVEVHATPRRTHAFFLRCEKKFPIVLKDQSGQDLGERMYRSFAQALKRHHAAVLIGTDCPALTPRDLRRAARHLASGWDVVLAPAEDGGYALIGARRIAPQLFRGIAWGTGEVYGATLQKLKAAGYRFRTLRTLWDVDRPEDLERLRALRFS